MAITSAPLNLLVFPQRWRPQLPTPTLDLAVLVFPQGDPRASFHGTETPFADADLTFEAVLVPSLDVLPAVSTPATRSPLNTVQPPRRRALFDALAANFEIRPDTVETEEEAPDRIMKFLPTSYRDAAHRTDFDSDCFVTDQSYECTLKSLPKEPSSDPLDHRLEWEEILALVLRQPQLARELGLIHSATLALPANNPFTQGGYLFADLAATSAYRSAVTGDPTLLARFAARIPPLTDAAERPVFASVLFPVGGNGDFDEVFAEADAYDDGFARMMHGAQARSSARTEPGPEPPPTALPPVKDGVRLGWDDEQVTVWLNRQFGKNARNLGADAPGAPLGVAGYRVDVREDGHPEASWTSLVAVEGDLELDGIDLGTFAGELAVETLPVGQTSDTKGYFWLPGYFAAWTGGSLVLTDPRAFAITGDTTGLGTHAVYHSVGADQVPLKYGHSYQFRVRLMDLTGGGPTSADAHDPAAPAPVAMVPFRRFVPPGPVRVATQGGPPTEGPADTWKVRRPFLGYPDILFTGVPDAMKQLLDDAPHAKVDQREAALPDPDVTHLQVDVLVRTLTGDPAADSDTARPYVPLYSVLKSFPADASQPLTLRAVFQDTHDAADLAATPPGDLDPLPLPTARDVRLVLTPVGRPDPALGYWGAQRSRTGAAPVALDTRAPSRDETALLREPGDGRSVRAVFLQPDAPAGPAQDAQLGTSGLRHEAPTDLVDRFAHDLGLARSGLTLSALDGTRLVLGAAEGLRHTLGPDRSTITFTTKDDLTRHWLICVYQVIDRDWTWDGLDTVAFEVHRDGILVGELTLPDVVNREVTAHPDRARTELLFIDTYDPKPVGTAPPQVTQLAYTLTPKFRSPPPQQGDREPTWRLTLPITTPPTQVPRLRSAGFAASDYVRDTDRYTSTGERHRMLYLELDGPPTDPQDCYFARVLAQGPDPMLLHEPGSLPDPAEPPLDLGEPIRVVTPSSSDDRAGFTLMQPLTDSDDPQSPPDEGRRYLLPLPEGLDADDPALFGFYVYELRVGHDATRWSTAHGRFGLPLRVAGVQHPPPQLRCAVTRTDVDVRVSAPHAVPVNSGVDIRPFPPRTRIGALLYAQVLQADGQDWRNILLQTQYASAADDALQDEADRHFFRSIVVFTHGTIRQRLATMGLPDDATLSVLAVELLPTRQGEPLGTGLGDTRVLRTSPLTPVPEVCTPVKRGNALG
ncbi:hypothetical protein [Streptomyces xylophagus]|uniref:hypothetical protein n=1 Tax=Streptomyces xylophagus TaxID=285514 RepID=UPI0005BD88C6|nr:hypothetical protein [Streptomyces xylophagus]